MGLPRQEDPISKVVKTPLLAKMLHGAVVLIWFILRMVQIKKVVVSHPSLVVVQITLKRPR